VIALAIGMTLVIATGGVDLSVGAIMAIVSSVAALLMNPFVLGKQLQIIKNDPTYSYSPFWVVLLLPMIAAIICGLWNGMLVAYRRIESMVATLILMISGRGTAQLIIDSQKIQIFYEHKHIRCHPARPELGAGRHPGSGHRRNFAGGGRFSLLASVIGALVMQTVTTSM
jgi:ribose/xylose/arabinose/galactoside ABC-type transport system permease subunit